MLEKNLSAPPAPTIPTRHRAPRVLRFLLIQLRRAGLRLRRLFAGNSARDERQPAQRALAVSAQKSRGAVTANSHPEESRAGLAGLSLGARRVWQRFALMPSQHRAWTFAAITGTLGILLLLLWQWRGGHVAAEEARTESNTEIVTANSSHENETPPESSDSDPFSTVLDAPQKPAADGIEDFRVAAKKPSEDPFDTPTTNEPTTSPSSKPESDWTDAAPKTNPSVATESLPLESPITENGASAAEKPASDPSLDFPTTKPEITESANAAGAASELPAPQAEPSRDNISFDSPAPNSDAATTQPTDDQKAAVRKLIDGLTTSRAEEKEKWNPHDESHLADPKHEAVSPTVDESPKSDARDILSPPKSPDDAAPQTNPAAPVDSTPKEPAVKDPAPTSDPTLPSMSEPAPTKPAPEAAPPAKEAEPSFPDVPSRSSVTDSAVTNVAAPQLNLIILSPSHVSVGRTCSVGFRVTNTGNVPTEEVRVLFDLPDGLSYRKGRALVYAVGTLSPGETREARLTARAESIGTGTCRGVLQTSGERITDAEAPIAISRPEPAIYSQPGPIAVRPFYSTPVPFGPCLCD